MLRNLIDARPALTLLLVSLFCTSLSLAQKSSVQHKPSSAISAAQSQLDRGDLDSCEKTLWTVLSGQPNNEQALTLLGIVRARQKLYTEAEALFRRVLQLNPKSIIASRNLAEVLLAQDKPDQAIEQYKQAMTIAPQDLNLKIKVVELDLARGNFAESLATLDTIKPDRFPTSAIPLKAASLLGMGRNQDAERLVPLVKASPGVALDLAQVFVQANDPDAALRSLALVNFSTTNLAARGLYLKGRALRQKKDSTGSLGSFRQALAADPKSVDTLIAMAEVFASQNKHADSLDMLEKARALDPKSLEVLRHLIVEAMRAGQNTKALQASQDLQQASQELDDRYLIASVMIQQKQYVPATHILEDYVAQRPQDAKAYLGLGIAYLNLLRYAEATQALQHSLQIKPDLAETEYQLGLLLAQQGSRQEAIQHWEKAVALQPHHAQALFSLGTTYLEEGELEKARTSFLASLAEDPNNMKTEYDVALVLNKMGNSQEASKHFERYRQMQEQEHTTNGNPPASADHP